MKELQFNKQFLEVAVMTLITIFVWTGFGIYQTLTKTQIPQVLQKQLEPLDPKISKTAVESLEQRNSFTQKDWQKVEKQLSEESTPSGVAKESTESGNID